MSASTQSTQELASDSRLIDSKATEERIGLSRWTLWRMERDGIFPISIKVGGKRLYVEAEVKNWIEARIAERAAV